jgi:hypothetical protein
MLEQGFSIKFVLKLENTLAVLRFEVLMIVAVRRTMFLDWTCSSACFVDKKNGTLWL